MTHSLAARLTAAISLVVLLLTAVSVTLTGLSLRSRSNEAREALQAQDEASWRRLLEEEARVLASLGRVAAADSGLRSLISAGPVEARPLQALVTGQQALLGVELLLVTGPEGGVLAASLPGPVVALDGLLKEAAPGVIFFREQPYRAVARPVEAGGRTVGHVVLASRLSDALLHRLQEQRGVEGLLHVGPKLMAQAVGSVPVGPLLHAVEGRAGAAELVVQGVRLNIARHAVGQGVELVLVRGPGAGVSGFGATLALVIFLGTAVVLAAGAAVFFLVRRLMAPLRELTAATARVVAEGDFRGTLEVRSKDEIGQLAASFTELMAQLRSLLVALRSSAEQLDTAATQLTESASVQNEAVSQQAVALHETQLAAQQLQEASQAAARRVEAIQREAEQASGFGEAGEAAVSGSVGGLTHIRSHVEQMGRTISELNQRTRQVGDITRTVKDLADQSNVLALNASIEAARSGEAGRSFAVVARQLRSLADQSAGATTRVQAILGDIGKAISAAVDTSEGGAREVESGLEQVRAAGESLRSLATIIQNNGQAVRSIAEAVSQQDAGIAELFAALSSMADLADQIVDRMTASEQAAIQLSAASHELTAIVGRYQL